MENSKAGGTRKFVLWIGLALLVVVAVIGYLAVTAGNFVSSRLDYVTQSLASRSGVSVFLVKGLAFIVTIPFFIALAKIAKGYFGLLNLLGPAIDPLDIYRSKAGWVVVTYFGLFWIAMWGASRQAYAYKFCAVTPEGIVTADSPGKDPIYGIAFQPCTPDQAKVMRALDGKLRAAHEITVLRGRRVQWFDGATGQPRIWYVQREDGYHFFDGPGNDPDTGKQVTPVTQVVVSDFHARQRTADAQAVSMRKRVQAEAERKQQATAEEISASKAQALFETQNYKGALQACKPVLDQDASNEVCLQVKRDASTEWAHKLVDEGQAQLQKAQFDGALRNAREAIRLDPENEPAKRLQTTANLMKQKISLN